MPVDAQLDRASGAVTLHELVQRRRDLALQLGRQKLQIHSLSTELRQLDAQIQGADGHPAATPVNKLFTRRLGARAGGLTHLIADLFASSPAGLTSRDIAAHVLTVLGLDAADRKAMRYAVSRVCVALWVMEQKGLVRKRAGSQIPQIWAWCGPRGVD
jgi:hypothetical protein